MRHFTRTPYYTGPDDPERGEVRGTLQLDETVIIETTGGPTTTTKPLDFSRRARLSPATATPAMPALVVLL